MRPESIARVCHEANRALQYLQPDSGVGVSASWDYTTNDQRESAIEGVRKVLEGATTRDSHAAWMARKHREGWEYGEYKSEVSKTHPNMVSYDDLPHEQRVKDVLFRAIVLALKDGIDD